MCQNQNLHALKRVNLVDLFCWVKPIFLNFKGVKKLKNNYITFSYDRNDEVGNYWRFWSWGASISVSERLDCGHGVFTETVGGRPKK